MAYTAHKNPEQIVERFDDEETLNKKVDKLVQLIHKSKHMIAFTGAGISTSAGIPDFRGPQGVWTLKAQGKARTEPTTSVIKAIPTITHMSFVQLQKAGYLKFMISQNCDGLIRRSGFPPDHLAELHGNSNLEVCSKCGKEYLRDFSATASYRYSVNDHRTGRVCNVDECKGELVDTIINFGENLPAHALKQGFSNAEKADLCISLGSSLTVKPACQMPEYVGKHGKLVICNLQNTPYDDLCYLRIYARCDDLMKRVMEKLELEIPPFILHRRMHVTKNNNTISIKGVDFDGTPSSIFSKVIINENIKIDKEPYETKTNINSKSTKISLFFYGHYNEPRVDIDINGEEFQKYFDLHYNPMTGVWNVEDKGSQVEFIKTVKRKLTDMQKIPDKIRNNEPAPKVQEKGFSVTPKRDCPHFGSNMSIGITKKVDGAVNKNICNVCKDGSENWMCLACGETFCSRYVSGHAKEHYKNTKHCVALSFSDLSVWCYACNDYITDPILDVVVSAASKAKFS